jgi:hypothetical protein
VPSFLTYDVGVGITGQVFCDAAHTGSSKSNNAICFLIATKLVLQVKLITGFKRFYKQFAIIILLIKIIFTFDLPKIITAMITEELAKRIEDLLEENKSIPDSSETVLMDTKRCYRDFEKIITEYSKLNADVQTEDNYTPELIDGWKNMLRFRVSNLKTIRKIIDSKLYVLLLSENKAKQ